MSQLPLDRKNETRKVLLAAMVEVAGRKGYAQASVESVLDCADVARGTFYRHFSNRDECFLAALEEVRIRLEAEVEIACREGAEDLGATQAATLALVSYSEREPAAAKALLFESLGAGPRSLEIRAALLGQVEALVSEFDHGSDGQVARIEVPLPLAIGGVARLLAMRLRYKQPNLGDLHQGLLGWLASYAVGVEEPSLLHNLGGSVDPIYPHPLAGLDPPPDADRLEVRDPDSASRFQRQIILRALSRCSYAKGYAEVGIADVLEVAGVSRKAFYSQFQSKTQAGVEANEETFQAAMTATATAFFAAREWPERVWEAGRALLGFIAAYPADAYLGFAEPHAIGEATVRHIYDRLQAFTLFLEEGYAYRPQAKVLPRLCSEVLAASMFELAAHDLSAGGGPNGLLKRMPQLAYTILAPFMGPAAAAEFAAGKTDAG